MDSQSIPVACKKARLENGALNSEQLGTLTLFHHKTSKGSDHPSSSNANASEYTTMTSQVAPALTEFPVLELITAKETHPPTNPPSFDASALEKYVPPVYLELINDMEKKIRDVSMEKDTLKTELMQAQAMINVLQSRIDQLSKENNKLRRGV